MRHGISTNLTRKLAARVTALGPVRTARRRLTTSDRWNMRSLEPVSRRFGWDRGQPIDRYYIESFLETNAGDIRGRVLEVGDARYTKRFGRGAARSDVLDVTPDNRHATLIADLAARDGLPADAFDCFILAQTLQLVFDVRAAIAQVHRALGPGGVVLATLPAVSKLAGGGEKDSWRDHWRFTQASAAEAFCESFDDVSVAAYGNVLTACAFLQGLAAEELDKAELEFEDPEFPVVVGVRAVK